MPASIARKSPAARSGRAFGETGEGFPDGSSCQRRRGSAATKSSTAFARWPDCAERLRRRLDVVGRVAGLVGRGPAPEIVWRNSSAERETASTLRAISSVAPDCCSTAPGDAGRGCRDAADGGDDRRDRGGRPPPSPAAPRRSGRRSRRSPCRSGWRGSSPRSRPTAKPLPASPARAASMVALSARRLSGRRSG